MKRIPTFLEMDENLEAELFLNNTYIYNTQKRVYIKKQDADEKTEKTINIDTVSAVCATEVKKKRSKALLVWGIIILLAAVALYIFKLQMPAFIVGGVGALLTVLGVFVCLPRYFLKLEIATSGYPIVITFEKLKTHQENQLKGLFFGLLVKRTQVGFAMQGTPEIPQSAYAVPQEAYAVPQVVPDVQNEQQPIPQEQENAEPQAQAQQVPQAEAVQVPQIDPVIPSTPVEII